MKTYRLRRCCLLVAVVSVLAGFPSSEAARRARPRLPDAAMKALKTAFPGVFIESVHRDDEDEDFVVYWVEMEHKGQGLEVAVTPEGLVVRIEQEADKQNAPKPVAEAIAREAGGARILEFQQAEVRALASHGRFHELEKPLLLFNAELVKDKMAAEMTVAADGTVVEKPRWRPRPGYESIAALPEKAAEAVKQRFPEARIVAVDLDHDEEEGPTIYVVQLTQAGREISVFVSADGRIVEVEAPASADKIPKPAAATIRRLSTGGTVREVRVVEALAIPEFRQLLRLKRPFKVYVARFSREDMTMQMVIAEDGKVIEKPTRAEEEEDDD